MVGRILRLLVLVILCLSTVSCRAQQAVDKQNAVDKPVKVRYTLVFPPGQDLNEENKELWKLRLTRRAQKLGMTIDIIEEESGMVVTLPKDCSDDIFRQGHFMVLSTEGAVLLASDDVVSVQPYQTTQNQDAVLFSLNHQAKDAFKQETAERQGETTKIYLDDELMSTFTINAQINDGKFLLAGKRPVADAHMFSVLIEHPLPLQVDVFSQETENE